MSASCCESKSCELDALREKHSKVLKTVFAVNALFFFIEAGAGWWARSTALLGDSLDMFGDASVYAFSLWALAGSALQRNRAVRMKGWIMVILGVVVLGQALARAYSGTVPLAEAMGRIGLAALLANTFCFALLYRHRSDDLNMKSVWLCSRNDLIANSTVLLAALGVFQFNSIVPDLLVGCGIAYLFLSSAASVLRSARLPA